MRSVTSAELLSRLRSAVGAENDTHVKDPELYKVLTSAVADTWDQILSYGIGTEGVKSYSLTAIPGQIEYDLTSLVPDFYRVEQLYVVESDGRKRSLGHINPSEIYCSSAPRQGANLKLYYFPVAPTFSTGTETFDGINGWEEHTIQVAAIYIKAKKEDDTGQFRARKRELEARMQVMANRLQDSPPRVVRRHPGYGVGCRGTRYGRHGYDLGFPYNAGVRSYNLRGANLELYA